jgi:hypothetical protein
VVKKLPPLGRLHRYARRAETGAVWVRRHYLAAAPANFLFGFGWQWAFTGERR